MRLVAIQRLNFREFDDFRVNPRLGISPLSHLGKQFFVVPLASPDERREKHALAPAVVSDNQRDYLVIGVAHHFFSRRRGVGLRCTGVQKSQKIIYFRNRADRRTRVLSRRLLLDCDDGAESLYALHLRLFEYSHKMLRVG